MRRPRLGMTLVEILMAIAIVALLAAVLYPTAAGQLRQGHAAALGNQLVNLRDAIANYRQNVGAFPSSLSQLTTQPVAGATDACGTVLSAAERNAWRGPYMNQNVVGPMPVGNAFVQVALTRLPPTLAGGMAGMLLVQAVGVDSDIATDLEEKFDGNGNLAAGNVTWTAAGEGTLTFQIPIRGC